MKKLWLFWWIANTFWVVIFAVGTAFVWLREVDGADVTPNLVTESGDVDANYFQHLPYLQDFNEQNGTHLVSVAAIHVEPLGIYGGKQNSLDIFK